jgi:HAMP domain-containing protein
VYPAAVAERRRSTVGKWVERVALGAIMGAVAFVVERRLLKAIRRKGDTERRTDSGKLELAVTAEQVDQ